MIITNVSDISTSYVNDMCGNSCTYAKPAFCHELPISMYGIDMHFDSIVIEDAPHAPAVIVAYVYSEMEERKSYAPILTIRLSKWALVRIDYHICPCIPHILQTADEYPYLATSDWYMLYDESDTVPFYNDLHIRPNFYFRRDNNKYELANSFIDIANRCFLDDLYLNFPLVPLKQWMLTDSGV